VFVERQGFGLVLEDSLALPYFSPNPELFTALCTSPLGQHYRVIANIPFWDGGIRFQAILLLFSSLL
jgi:hypothetical protein